MAMKAGLGLGQRQTLALTPGMRSSLALLRMPAEALREDILREAAENPFLLADEGFGGGVLFDFAEATTPARESLIDSLARQIALQRLDPATAAAALYLAGQLRDDGYLDVPLDELAGEAGVDKSVLDRGLAALQGCEPAGIGARSLAECLSLQLVEAGVAAPLAAAAVAQLADFAAGRHARLSRSLGIAEDEVARLAALIRTLKPAPLAPGEVEPATRVPDLLVEIDQSGRPFATVNDAALPSISVMRLATRRAAGDEMQALFARAERMVAGVEARRRTLKRIGEHFVQAQPDFFLRGQSTLRPASQAETARLLGMHPSTLSRAIAGKSLAVSGKVYPLSVFFPTGLPADQGLISAYDLQRRISALVAGEDPASPLADDAICAHLRKEGVDIARRTVAKYRKWLRIPSSYERRRRMRPALCGNRARPSP